MTKKSINETVESAILPIVAAGVAAYAGHKLYKNYKRKKTLGKYGVKEESRKSLSPDDEDVIRDMAYWNATEDLPAAYNTAVKK